MLDSGAVLSSFAQTPVAKNSHSDLSDQGEIMATSSPSESPSDLGASPSGPTKAAKPDLNFGFTADNIENPVIPDLASGEVLRNRYRIHRSLGKGGFGGVYLALDLNLNRKVAIKRQIGRHLDDTELARNEAKFIAGLDHPAIVKIYDLVDDENEGVLIIMEYVNGYTLHELMKRKRLSIARALELGIEIAQALIHAHSRRIVHRDLKPSNVLLDQTERVKLSDFGLALGAINLDTAPSAAGTPKYMAPEQVRGESHRTDGRSDIWALGVILYEMLSGTHPFAGPSRGAIFEAILHDEPTPLRQLNPLVPEDVEHIVHRCLRKRMSERPASATDLEDDLKACLAAAVVHESVTGAVVSGQPTAVDSPDSHTPASYPSSSHQRPLRVEPKGLRPYSEEDGVQYLDLIPGPRERSGLPESIHFWKKWASCDSVDEYASAGVLYGPSGAGKTSFVRAGLINQLDSDICSIVIECHSGDLAGRIEQAILSRFRQKTQAGSLSKLLSNLRKDEGDVFGYRKILIILDQFESWSTTATTEDRRTLAEALRHCDGKTLQSLFVVRDDYWSGITEIMQWIDVPLVENRNVRSLELLDRRHAQRILEGMGRAHGILPRASEPLTSEQQVFIREAIEGLSNNGRVVAVHLVMFAQISRVLPWTPQMLRKQGGVEGACAAYLYEIFETSSGPPAYRRLAGVVADILNELLPPQGVPLKANVKSIEDLRARLLSAGAGTKCTEAIRVLSEDLKLITPTRNEEGGDLGLSSTEGYQLAHDFLVEPVRNWVELARKSTWRGRAVARLVELSELWQRKPQKQFLPTLREFAAMQMVVPSSSRNEKQTKYLRAAGRYHAGRVAATTVATVAALIFGALAIDQYSKAASADQARRYAEVSQFIHGKVSEVPSLLDELGKDTKYLPMVNALLENSKEPHVRLRGGLLAQRLGKETFASVAEMLEDAEPELFSAILKGASVPDAKQALESTCFDATTPLRRKARAAILLLYLDDDRTMRRLLKFDPDPKMRESIVREAMTWRGSPEPWVKLTNANGDLATQYGGFAVLATYEPVALANAVRWTDVEAMRSNAECLVHSLSEWLINLNPNTVPNRKPASPPANANWTTNAVGMELRRIEAGTAEYLDLASGHQRISVGFSKPLWVALTPVTRKHYEQFLAEIPNYPNGSPIPKLIDIKSLNDADECKPNRPAMAFSIDDAFCFCNWISRKEGLSEVYKFNGTSTRKNLDGKEFPVLTWVRIESANGYRLLNEKEFLHVSLNGVTEGAAWKLAFEINSVRDSFRSSPTPDAYQLRLVQETLPNPLGIFINDDYMRFWIEDPNLIPRDVALIRKTSEGNRYYLRPPKMSNLTSLSSFILVAKE